jgi:hypothetical protein
MKNVSDKILFKYRKEAEALQVLYLEVETLDKNCEEPTALFRNVNHINDFKTKLEKLFDEVFGVIHVFVVVVVCLHRCVALIQSLDGGHCQRGLPHSRFAREKHVSRVRHSASAECGRR